MRLCAPLALLLLLFTACDDTVYPVPARTYTPDWFGVQRLCYDYCVQCHNTAFTSWSYIALPDAIQSDIESGDDFFVTPGSPANSFLWQVLNANQPVGAFPYAVSQMPLGRPLPADQLAPVKQWILDGASLR